MRILQEGCPVGALWVPGRSRKAPLKHVSPESHSGLLISKGSVMGLSPVGPSVVCERLGVVLGPCIDDVVAAGEGDGYSASPHLAHKPAAQQQQQQD